MSDTDTTHLDLPEVLDLPETTGRATRPGARQRQLYKPGADNIFTYTDENDEEREGYFRFDAARLTRSSVREQIIRRNRPNAARALMVVSTIVIDGAEIGYIREGTKIPHVLFREPRYAAWANSTRAKSIHAQQWVQARDEGLVREFATFLRNEAGFNIRLNVENAEDSPRKTTDKLQARPATPFDPNDPKAYGVKLDAFEVTTNSAYENGFENWIQGLDSQRRRWETAYTLPDPEERMAYLKALVQNVHFLGGAYPDPNSHTWWARPVDVGMLMINGTELRLYARGGEVISEDLFSDLAKPVEVADDDVSATFAALDAEFGDNEADNSDETA